MQSRTWQPVFSGHEAEACLSRVRDVLATVRLDAHSHMIGVDWGVTLLELYAGLGGVTAPDNERLSQHADAVFAAAPRLRRKGLYGGLAGVGWILSHLDRMTGSNEFDLSDIDTVLLDAVEEQSWPCDYDLINGHVGIAVYCLETPGPLSGPRAALFAKLIDVLLENSVNDESGTTWMTAAHLLPPSQLRSAPNGYFNLGVAHGVPGVLHTLASAYAADVRRSDVEVALDRAVRWLLAQRLGANSGFASWVPHNAPRILYPTSSSWCYGGLGLSVTLLRVAELAGRDDWRSAAIDIADFEAQRNSSPADAGVCHGIGGNAHLFNRVAQSTGLERFAEASRQWLRRTLAFHAPEGAGIAGYRKWTTVAPGATDTFHWEDSTEFLTGATGTALVLLAAATGVAPQWDRVLLVE